MNEQKAAKPIALIKTGGTIDQIKPLHGDFEDWFGQGMGGADLLQIDVFRYQRLPVVEEIAGIVITGSASMVSAQQDWSEHTAEWLARAVQKDVPVLGVCYGHQLLAHALGGLVGPNPAGRQIGTIKAHMLEGSDSDPLLGHLPRTFAAQTSHLEAVLKLPADAQRLATSALDANFAIRFADQAWGVQFHPEFSRQVMSKYIIYRANQLRKEGINPEDLLDQTAATSEAQSLLRNFVKIVFPKEENQLKHI
jgi:GMP synthase (glutamine-hydrolysing)